MRCVAVNLLLVSLELAGSCSFLVTSMELNHESLQKANYFLKMRGPDRTNVGRYHGLNFVHNLLHMTGAFTEQPIRMGKLITVFNGEIYNFRDLSARFGFTVPPSDGDAILPLYQRLGTTFVQHLRGEFALVVADFQRGILLLATDTFGTKPFWVGHGEQRLFGVASYSSGLERLGLTQGLRQLRCNTVEIWDLASLDILETFQVFTFDLRQFKTDYNDWNRAFVQSMDRRTRDLQHGAFVGLSSGIDSGVIALSLILLNVSHHVYSIENPEDLGVLRKRHLVAREHGASVRSIHLTNKEAEASKKWIQEHVEKYEFAGVRQSDWEYNVTDPDKLKLLHSRQAELRAGVHKDAGSIGLSHICGIARTEGIKVYLSGAGVDEIYSDYEGASTSIFSTFGGRFPSNLQSIFPWPNFFYGAQRDFLRKDELVAGAHGIEGRYPFLDVDLVQEFLWLDASKKSAPKRHSNGRMTGFKLPLIAALENASYPFTQFKRKFNALRGISAPVASPKHRQRVSIPPSPTGLHAKAPKDHSRHPCPASKGMDSLPELHAAHDVPNGVRCRDGDVVAIMTPVHFEPDANLGSEAGTPSRTAVIEVALAKLGVAVVTIWNCSAGTEKCQRKMPVKFGFGQLVHAASFSEGACALGLPETTTPAAVVLVSGKMISRAQAIKTRFPTSRIVCWPNQVHTAVSAAPWIPLCDTLITTSITAMQFSHAVLPDYPAARIRAVYNPMREREAFYMNLSLMEVDRYQIIATGKQHPAKQRRLAAELVKLDSRFRLVIAAPDWQKHSTKEYGAAPGLSFLGAVRHPQLMEIMAKSLVSVDWTTFPESFGYVFAEPALLRVPTIATHVDNSTTEELLSPEPLNVILPKAATARDIAEQVQLLQMHKELARPSSSRIRQAMRIGPIVSQWLEVLGICPEAIHYLQEVTSSPAEASAKRHHTREGCS